MVQDVKPLRYYNSSIGVAKDIMRVDGVFGFYKTTSYSLWGIVVYRSLYFGLYESIPKPNEFFF